MVLASAGPVLAASYLEPDPPAPQAPCDVTVRIMPLGDSITKGSGGEVPTTQPENIVGYRKYLWDSLQLAGYNVNFVGSQVNGYSFAGFDADHEGHGGYTDAQVARYLYNNDAIVNWLPDNPAEVILLHIGTNDLNADPADVQAILNEIDEYEADTGSTVTVILARIINRAPPIQLTTTFNDNVTTMAQQRINNGDLIIPVNMESGAGMIYTFWDDQVTPGDMFWNGSNGLHPYHTGYIKMADLWKITLDPLLQECNHPPSIANPGSRSSTENDPVSFYVTAADADNDQLTYSARNLPPGLTINSTSGLISGTLSYQASAGSPYSVQVKVTDDGQLRRSQAVSFTWTVANLNRPPVLSQPGDQTSAEGSFASLQLSASDPDGDTISYSADGLPPGLSVGQNTGLISGTVPFGATAGSPYTVTVTATDNGSPAKQTMKTFSWTITNVNRPPQITNPGNQAGIEGGQVTLPITASDPDGDSLAYSATNLPIGLTINAGSGIISGTIGCQAAGSYPVKVKATDNGSPSLSAEASFTWTISPANCAPLLVNPGNQTSAEGGNVSLQVNASDPDGPETLAFTAQGLPPGLGISSGGLISGNLSFEAGAGSPYSVKVTATDPGGKSASASFQWAVQNTNRPPVLQPVPDQTNTEQDTVWLKLEATDPDQDALEFSLQGGPAGVSINASTGSISGQIACGAAGIYTATVTVTDGAATDSDSFSWQILAGNCKPPDQWAFIPITLNR